MVLEYFLLALKVGDNVGDCAARGADLFESIAAEIISAMILGGTMAKRCKIEGKCKFPLLIDVIVLFLYCLCCEISYFLTMTTANGRIWLFKPNQDECLDLIRPVQGNWNLPFGEIKRDFVASYLLFC